MKQLLLVLTCLAAVFGAGPLAVGERPPAFTLMNLDGTPREFNGATEKGSVVLLAPRGFPGYQFPLS